jgi:hypothetical protein
MEKVIDVISNNFDVYGYPPLSDSAQMENSLIGTNALLAIKKNNETPAITGVFKHLWPGR